MNRSIYARANWLKNNYISIEIEFMKLQNRSLLTGAGKVHPKGEATLHAGCDPAPARFQAFEWALGNFTL